MDGAVLTGGSSIRGGLRRALETTCLALAAACTGGCTHATCNDYHQPGCWTQPPDASADDAGLSDATIDAGLGDGGAVDEGTLDASTPDAAPPTND